MFKQSVRTARCVKPTSLSSVRPFSVSSVANQRISEYIKDDHAKLETEYRNIKNATTPDEKTRWRNQFTWTLARHSIGEELVVYPQFEKHLPNGKEMADHDRDQHNKVKVALKEVQDMDVHHGNFETRLDDLWKNLSEHIKEEEKNDLPALESKLSQQDSDALTTSIDRTKNFLPTKSHPNAPDKPPFETIAGLFAAPMDLLRNMFEKFPNTSEGAGKSHARDLEHDSIVPEGVQKAVPESLERTLPNAIHDTGDKSASESQPVGKTHAKGGGKQSVVPESVQRAVPESVERALPNKVHDTGNK